MKKITKILCSTFGLLSVLTPTIITSVSCSNNNDTIEFPQPEPTPPIPTNEYDIARDFQPTDIIDNGTVLKIPDKYEKVNFFIGLSGAYKPLNVSQTNIDLLSTVVKIQLPQKIKSLNLDIPFSTDMTKNDLSDYEGKILSNIMPKFNQLVWTWPDGSVHENDPGDIHLDKFRINGAATRLLQLIVPYANKYDVSIGTLKYSHSRKPGVPIFDSISEFNNYDFYRKPSPDIRLKEVDLSHCKNLLRTKQCDSIFDWTNGIHFYFCPTLEKIIFNDTLKEISPNFLNCSYPNLKVLHIPKSVETMILTFLDNAQVMFDTDSNLKELIFNIDEDGNYNSYWWKNPTIIKSNVKILDLSHCQKYFAENYENFAEWFGTHNYENYKIIGSSYVFSEFVEDYNWERFGFPISYINEKGETILIDDSWKHDFLYRAINYAPDIHIN